jgi:hypothetical protein
MKKFLPLVLFGCLVASVSCKNPYLPGEPVPLFPTPTFTIVPCTPNPSITPTKTPTAALSTATPTPSPTPNPSSSPTPTGTYVCGFATITVQFPTITSTPFPTPVSTIIPYGPILPAPVLPPVTTVTPIPHPTFTPGGYVVRSVAEWQALYGPGSLPPASVDFSSQMILIDLGSNCPCQSFGFLNVCETGAEVDVTVFASSFCNMGCPEPLADQLAAKAVVVPASNLPIVWIYQPGVYEW